MTVDDTKHPAHDACPPLERQKILIVDDRRENLFALETTLACLDVEIVGATSGNQALVSTLDNDFALAILDVKMPGMDGYELAEILRGEKRTQVLPIIFNTASYADELHAFKGYEAGCIDYIVKPCAPEILVGKVRTLLELDRHRRQLEHMVEARTRQLQHLNSVLDGIRHVNRLIVREKKPGRLIESICQRFIQTRGFHFAFITLLDAAGKLSATAEVGLGEGFDVFVEKTRCGELATCHAKALTQQPPVITPLPHPDCGGCPLSQNHSSHASITLRLEHGGRLYGLMTLAMPRHVADDHEEVALLTEAGGDIAYALHTLEKEHRLRLVLANMRDVIWLMDMNLVPIWVSAEHSRGYSVAELTALPLAQQMTPESYQRVMAAYRRAITPEALGDPTRNISVALEIEFTKKNGATAWAATTFAVVRDDEGVPLGIVGSSHDIEALKRSEMALTQKTRDLSERVKELHCLYSISKLITDSADPIEVTLHEVAELIPTGWLYPAITCARITYHQKSVTSAGFRETPWTLSAEIHAADEVWGRVEVFLLTECPPRDEGPFLMEERLLIDNLAERLGAMMESRQARSQDRLAREVLELLNRKKRSQDLLLDILKLIQCSTGLNALAIRLTEGDGGPCEATLGFSDAADPDGPPPCRKESPDHPIRGKADGALSDGLCQRILSGETAPSAPPYTPGGSFWTRTAQEARSMACPGTRCPAHGFESNALIPLTADGEILGLLHLGDPRPHCFNLSMIHFFEDLGKSIGIALAKNRLEKALRESEALLKETGAMAQVGGWELDLHSQAMCWTGETYRIHGVPLGIPVTLAETLAFYDETGRSLLADALALCKTTKKPFDLELKLSRADGRNIQTRVTGRAVGITGTVAKLMGTVQDITERKKLEEQLHQAMKMEAIGRLAGGVAHDFNNALTPILAVSGLLLADLPPQDAIHDDIREIQEAADRCARLTRQLLAFGRRQPMQLSLLNLNTVVTSMEKMLSRIIGEDVELTLFLDPELGNTRADVGKVEQIIANLAVNARDAMPLGGKLTIETRNVTIDEACAADNAFRASGPLVMLAISDTGEGMDEETRAQIFEPFFTTKESGKGTGLGLSTVYGIIKQSQGNIWVYSEPGQGSTFKVYLPRVDEAATTPAKKTRLPGSSLNGTETILLVEDEASVRKTARRILSAQGYTVVEAENGDEALARHASHDGPIHILVTDVVMPGMSGKEVADRLVAMAPTLKVLFVSGYTDNTISHHGVLDHGTHFIQKPFTAESLAGKVREVLDS